MSAPKLALGKVSSSTPLSDDFSRDFVLNSVRKASCGGSATVDYFNMVDVHNQMFKQVIDHGESAWNVTEDTNGLPLHYMVEDDKDGNKYYIELATTDLIIDESGNVSTSDDSQTINGTTYNGIGTVTMSLGFQGSKFFTVCWWLGKGTAGVIALALLKPLLQKCLKSIVSQLSVHMQKIWANLVGSSGAEIEAGIEESSAEADAAIAEEAGIEIAEIGAAEIAIGVLSFIAIGLIVAVLGIVFIFVLHESSQRVRIWNVTSYKARWMIYFHEGQMVSGPVKFNSDGSINTFVPFMPVERKVTPEAHYGDLIIDSGSGTHGIGYVIQIQLVDPNHEDDVKYACTLMYDIPFAGDNSTAVTFDHITDVGKFYSDNMGVHKCTQQTAESSDGRIRATTTYDYLRGEHVKPQQVDSSGGNVAYYYQSVILLEEKDLSV